MEEFEQMGLLEATYEPFAIKNKIRLIELFGGIGSQAKALEVLGADFEHYRLVEWSTNSIIAYDVTNYSNMRSLAKELKQAARECIKFAVFYEDGEGSLPSGEHLQKFIYIY